MAKPVLHLVGLFHTQHTAAYSHCAFTGKALRFSKMLQKYGYKVVEYANEGSESVAEEKVAMLGAEELAQMTNAAQRTKQNFHGDLAAVGTPWHQEFENRLIPAMKARVQPRDLICHPFGHAHSRLLSDFPQNIHIETGIGYPTTMPGTVKIFESYAWRHYHCGKDGRQGSNYEYVIPNYFEVNDWQPCYRPGEYVAFLGRIDACKGLDTIYEIAKYTDKKIVLHGQGDPAKWAHPNIEYRGPIHGKQRSEFLRNALCSIMPTNFIEPFGGSGVEGLLCGTPLIATDYGAFTETVQHGVNGFRCKTLQDWLEAIDAAHTLNRVNIADKARATYSLETCGAAYDKAFQQISQLFDKGWYSLSDKFLARAGEL
ncbi:glycosyltransferase [bacterium]|nr:glycosyltransferase [bacterium]